MADPHSPTSTAESESAADDRPGGVAANTAGVDKSGARIREMFSEISPRYDFLNHALSGGTDVYWRWRTVRAAGIKPGDPVLDVCTGTGDLALAFWKKYRTPVVGSDFTHAMLEIANEKSAPLLAKQPSANAPSLAFLEADTQRLPFADDSFQIVSVAFGLRNVADTRAGLREMLRVCRPGGKVMVLEFSLPGNRLIRSGYQWYFRHILPRIGQLFATNRHAAYNYLPQSVSEFPYGEALAEIMRGCGMQPVTWTPLTLGVATLYCGTKPADGTPSAD